MNTVQRYTGKGNNVSLPRRTAKKPQKKASRPYEGPTLSSEELATEQWLPIKDFMGRYEVSDMGRIRSIAQGHILIQNGGYRRHAGGAIKLGLDRNGYVRFNAKRAGRQKIAYVHLIVAATFIPNPQNLPVVNHLDGNPHNNRQSNLEWVTQKDNVRHAVEIGLIKTIEAETVKQILQEYDSRKQSGMTAKSIGARHGISKWTVWRIASNCRKAMQNSPSPTPQAINNSIANPTTPAAQNKTPITPTADHRHDQPLPLSHPPQEQSRCPESWRPLPNYEKKYELSSLGQLRDLQTGQLLPLHLHPDGYVCVALPKTGKRKAVCLSVHWAVALTFLPNPEGLPFVRHKDGNPLNNKMCNLTWAPMPLTVTLNPSPSLPPCHA